MSETRPPPLVPADTDLRSFTWLPLPVSFTQSNEWLCASPAGRAAMTSLAVASWHQIPASSLPANDTALAVLSQSGANWRRIRSQVLAGWTECRDGRLYHPILAEVAAESMVKRKKQAERTEAARLALMERRSSVTDAVTGSTGQDRIEKDRKKEKSYALKEKAGRLPADWQPSTLDQEFASGLDLDIALTAAEFRDYWIAKAGKDGIKADWSATWRGYCRLKEKRGETLKAAHEKEFGRVRFI